MVNNDQPHPPRVDKHADRLTLIGLAAFLVGMVVWVWVGDWRFGATGFLMLLSALFAVGMLYPGRRIR